IRDATVTGVQTCALPISFTVRFTDARLAHGERDAGLLPPLLAAQRQAELVEEELLEDQPLVRGRAKGVEGFDILGRRREVHVGRSEERRVGKGGGAGGWP